MARALRRDTGMLTDPFSDVAYPAVLSAEQRTEIDRFLDQPLAFRLSCHARHFVARMAAGDAALRYYVSVDAAAGWDVVLSAPALQPAPLTAQQQQQQQQHGKEAPPRVVGLRAVPALADAFAACTAAVRNARCMQLAFADLILLTSSALHLTSKWSSFSEVAALISRTLANGGCVPPPEGAWLPLAGTTVARLRQQRRAFVRKHKVRPMPHPPRMRGRSRPSLSLSHRGGPRRRCSRRRWRRRCRRTATRSKKSPSISRRANHRCRRRPVCKDPRASCECFACVCRHLLLLILRPARASPSTPQNMRLFMLR